MRIHTRVLFPLVLALLAAASFATAADAARKKKAKPSRYPVVTAVKPRFVQIGDYMTIKGRNFRPGVLRSTVAFYRPGKRVVFIKASRASRTSVTVPLTEKLLPLFSDSQTTPRWIKLRVIGYKMGKSWTKMSRSVNINPVVKVDPNQPPPPPKTLDQMTCPERAVADPKSDEDKDTVPNWLELRFKTDPCKTDTDGDGVSDGFETWSSFDLNNSPYPSDPNAQFTPFRRPSANPLDPNDANMDWDGDGLTMVQEYRLWVAGGAPFPNMNYSDGQQSTGGVVNVANNDPLNLNGDGILTDDERDFDGDGLSNMIEFNTRGTQRWWNAQKWSRPHGGPVEAELPYSIAVFPEVDATLRDTDGDGISDGADDQDQDGVSNFYEMQVSRWQTGFRVHPYNPCLPNLHALNCSRYGIQGQKAWPPYDGDDTNKASVLSSDMTYVGPGDANYTADPDQADYTWVRWPWDRATGPGDAAEQTVKWDGRSGYSP